MQHDCMTLYKFIAMDKQRQAEASNGQLISLSKDAEHRLLLYGIDDFHVEVYYHKQYNIISELQP